MASNSVAILTVSDTCFAGTKQDKSGPALQKQVESTLGWSVVSTKCVADDFSAIRDTLLDWSSQNIDLILTTGGTGLSGRDVTPEATSAVLDRRADGLVHLIVAKSIQVTPMASLSRLIAGSRGSTLIVNLPGSQKGSSECLSFLTEVLPHAVDLLKDSKDSIVSTHKDLQEAKTPARSEHQPLVCPHKAEQEGDSKVDAGAIAGRARESPYPMISVKEAQSKVLERCGSMHLGTEVVSFAAALGRVLAEDIFAKDPLPPFPASVKDGYAVLVSDGAGVRHVVGGSNAGSEPSKFILKPGQCIRINTGGPVPKGANVVVQVEDTRLIKASADGREEIEVEILKAPFEGQDIRPIGCDIQTGEHILKKHSILSSAEIGLLATAGVMRVEVFKRPIISLLSTGNELQDPSCETLMPGCIRDSNKAMLTALLNEQGFLTKYGIHTEDIGIAEDDPGALLAKLRESLKRGDILVTTGGVSMGDKDLLKQILEHDLGAEIHFARVRMKPGKPTIFATLMYEGKQKIVLGLPGNPVSAFVTAQLYVLPAAKKLEGHLKPLPMMVRATLDQDVKLDPRPEYRRVVLDWNPGSPVASSLHTGGCQMSSRLMSCNAANGLLVLPGRSQEVAKMKAGTEVDALVIGPLLRSTIF